MTPAEIQYVDALNAEIGRLKMRLEETEIALADLQMRAAVFSTPEPFDRTFPTVSDPRFLDFYQAW